MAKLSLFVGCGHLIMVELGWLWVVDVKDGWLLVVVGGGGEIMAGHGWWWQNYTWSWVIVGGGSKIMAGRGCGWPWQVVNGRGWPHNCPFFSKEIFDLWFVKIQKQLLGVL